MSLYVVERDSPSVKCRLRVIRRHGELCPETSEATDCPGKNASKKCPLWLKGSRNGELVRKSLGTRSLEVAIQRANQEAHAGPEWDRITISEAIERFLRDKIETLIPGPPLNVDAAIAHSDTIRKYNDILKQLREFAEAKQIVYLEAITTDRLNEFRETWKGAYDHDSKTFKPKSLTGKQKYQESLKIFFRFAHDMEWITKNPAAKLTSYRIRRTDAENAIAEKKRTPLKPQEIQKILGLIPAVFPKIAGKLRAFFLVLASTSLRIGDIVSLPRSKVDGDTIMLSTGKTNQPVFLKLPPMAVEALNSFPSVSSKYYFWTGHGKLDTAKADWSEKMLKLYRAAGIEQRSHAFRDTLTTAVLGAGGNLETVAALLGHRDIKVTQKHYEHWDTERQRLLEEALERAWEKNGLSQAKRQGLPKDIVALVESGTKDEILSALETWINSGSTTSSQPSTQGATSNRRHSRSKTSTGMSNLA